LLVVLRFYKQGLIPETIQQPALPRMAEIQNAKA
jgi:hypothetical protein